MSFGDAVRSGFEHYAKFDGRASRPMFWWWFLFAILVSIVVNILDSAIFDGPLLTYVAALALLLPNLSVSIRRLHDTNRTGWWILISFIPIIGFIVLLIFYLQDSDAGPNEYGAPAPDRNPGTGAPPAPAPPAA